MVGLMANSKLQVCLLSADNTMGLFLTNFLKSSHSGSFFLGSVSWNGPFWIYICSLLSVKYYFLFSVAGEVLDFKTWSLSLNQGGPVTSLTSRVRQKVASCDVCLWDLVCGNTATLFVGTLPFKLQAAMWDVYQPWTQPASLLTDMWVRPSLVLGQARPPTDATRWTPLLPMGTEASPSRFLPKFLTHRMWDTIKKVF